jgi:hypothetical protein
MYAFNFNFEMKYLHIYAYKVCSQLRLIKMAFRRSSQQNLFLIHTMKYRIAYTFYQL